MYDRARGCTRRTIFTKLDPVQARLRRQQLSPAFSAANMAAFDEHVARHVDLAVDGMIAESCGGGGVDMYKWWGLMATDVVGLLSFGPTSGMLPTGEAGVPLPIPRPRR